MSINPNRKERVRGSGMLVTATSGRVASLFQTAPHKVFFHVRDTVGAVMGKHHKEVKNRTTVKHFRGGNMFFYKVLPKKKSVPKAETPSLADISAEAYSNSDAALGLETGGTFKPTGGARFMAIPIAFGLNKSGRPKAGYSSPAALQKSKRIKNKDLVSFRKPGNRSPILYQIKRLKTKTYLLPVFQLVRRITRKPRLGCMSTWDSLDADRDRRFRMAGDRILQELIGG